jgi:hypothetical protein
MTSSHMQICPGGLTEVSRHALSTCIQQGLDSSITARNFVIGASVILADGSFLEAQQESI